MEMEKKIISKYIELDDQDLLNEINRLKEDLKNTKKWLKELEEEKRTVEYTHKKIAKLALGFTREKYEMLIQEAQRRGLFN
ncbi:hypothetical protein [Defluviitalea phaphyphila]|uniref:hypothetical protein n=1 Tax=Defluviitalea phaphyphila TaxID=1473580 RepID=UPI000731BE49|nr:hypothetical protein [Defluviitalea phaphyphila]